MALVMREPDADGNSVTVTVSNPDTFSITHTDAVSYALAYTYAEPVTVAHADGCTVTYSYAVANTVSLAVSDPHCVTHAGSLSS